MARLLSGDVRDKCSCLKSGVCVFVGALILVLSIWGIKSYIHRVVFNLRVGNIIVQAPSGIIYHKYIVLEDKIIYADDTVYQDAVVLICR